MSSPDPFASEQPRERCLSHGAFCLSLRECLALILGTGSGSRSPMDIARTLLERTGRDLPEDAESRGFFRAMESSPDALLDRALGIGPAHQARLMAAFELGRRYAAYLLGHQGPLPAPAHECGQNLRERAVAQVPPSAWLDPREWLGIVPVYRSRALGSFIQIEKGVRTHVNIDPIELFARILALRPDAFYLFHNHPSGDLAPSPTDLLLTDAVRDLAEALGIPLAGHGIVSPRGRSWIVIQAVCAVRKMS